MSELSSEQEALKNSLTAELPAFKKSLQTKLGNL